MLCHPNVDDNNEIGNINGLIKLLMNGILCLCRLMVDVVLNIVCSDDDDVLNYGLLHLITFIMLVQMMM